MGCRRRFLERIYSPVMRIHQQNTQSMWSKYLPWVSASPTIPLPFKHEEWVPRPLLGLEIDADTIWPMTFSLLRINFHWVLGLENNGATLIPLSFRFLVLVPLEVQLSFLPLNPSRIPNPLTSKFPFTSVSLNTFLIYVSYSMTKIILGAYLFKEYFFLEFPSWLSG